MIYMLVLEVRILVDFWDKITILTEYLDYTNIFLPKFMIKLRKYNNNYYIIKLEKNKQSYYDLIYSMRLIELETLKTHIKINFTNSFIWYSKFFINTLILFNQKINSGMPIIGALIIS